MTISRFTRALVASTMLIGAATTGLDAQRLALPAPPPTFKTPPPGPAPVSITMKDTGDPVYHTLLWKPAEPGVTGYRIHTAPSASAQWTLRTPTPVAQLTATVFESWYTWVDTALVKPGAIYRVTAVYTDGREGAADFVYANPPQPQEPTGFWAQQTASGTVQLTWWAPPTAQFRLFGPGQPPTGTLTSVPKVTVAKLPDGVHTWQVISDYGNGGVTIGGPKASITLISTARYRVVANGFRVILSTAEEILGSLTADRHGKEDEVFAGFAMFHVARPQGLVLDQDLRRTSIHGDATAVDESQSSSKDVEVSSKNQPSSRVRAGSALPLGGLKHGDVYPPVLDPSVTVGTPGRETFPFIVWDGTLTDNSDAVVILPTLWESDGQDGVYTNWFLSEQAELTKTWADLQVQQALQSPSITLTTPPGWTYFGPTLAATDHPIGSIYDPAGSSGLIGPGKRLPRRAIILTRERIESTLATGTGIVAIPFADSNGWGPVNNGHYILYLQVQRVP